jgi:hypothetical protein
MVIVGSARDENLPVSAISEYVRVQKYRTADKCWTTYKCLLYKTQPATIPAQFVQSYIYMIE